MACDKGLPGRHLGQPRQATCLTFPCPDLIILPGGPGGSGVGYARSVGRRLASVLDGSFDIIGFDPRGVDNSLGVQCAPNGAAQAAYDGQEYIGNAGKKGSVTVEVFNKIGELRAKGCQKYSAFGGAIGKYISTSFAARDMDFIRQTIGQELINYIGYSYGTYLGMTYANLFPNKIGRFIIDGVVDPTPYGTSIYEDGMGALRDTDNVLLGFAKECELAGPVNCPLAALTSKITLSEEFTTKDNAPGKKLVAAIKQATKDLAENPKLAMDASFPGIVKDTDVFSYLFDMLYTPSRWQTNGINLGALFVDDNPNLFRQERFTQAANADYCPAETYTLYNGYYSVRCSDAEDLRSVPIDELVTKSARPDRQTWLSSKSTQADALTCRHWTRPVERYQGPWNAKLNNKILIISSLLDPVTPLASAEKVHALLSPSNSSYFLLHKGYGHTSNGQPGACTLRTIGNYLFNGTLLNEGKGSRAECSPDLVLFPPRSNVNSFAAKGADQLALEDAAELGAEIAAVNKRLF
ncbi:hypothetical protein HDU97_002124 [Phlyctochytrium planicorne]|nr:hypothetical protein HDU97_002124 [Phlyctochytrium planicorne]